MKKIALFTFFVFIISSYAHAANVALVVKDATALSSEHERDIKEALLELGHTITYVDKNSAVDYSTFDIIVIAGRPKDSAESLDIFASVYLIAAAPSPSILPKFP